MDITEMTSKEAFEMGLACGPLGTGNVDVGLLDTQALTEEYITINTQSIVSAPFGKIKTGEYINSKGELIEIYSMPVINSSSYINMLTQALIVAGVNPQDIKEHLKPESDDKKAEIGVYFKLKNNTFKVIAGEYCAQTIIPFGSGSLTLGETLWVSGTGGKLGGHANVLCWVQPNKREYQLVGAGLIGVTADTEGGYYVCNIQVPEGDINAHGAVFINTSFTLTLFEITSSFIFSSYQNRFYRRYLDENGLITTNCVDVTYKWSYTSISGVIVLFNQKEYPEEVIRNLGGEPIMAGTRVYEAFYSCVHTTVVRPNVPVKVVDIKDSSKYFYGLHLITSNTIRPVFFILSPGTMLP